MCLIYIYIYIYIHANTSYHITKRNWEPQFPPPPPLSWPLYDIFSGAVQIDRPYGALIIFHTAGSVVGVGVEIVVLSNRIRGVRPKGIQIIVRRRRREITHTPVILRERERDYTCIYIYIYDRERAYIYIYREREIYTYTYTYVYMLLV